MKTFRIAIAAATFAAVSSVAFASDANANGRSSVYATGKSVTATSTSTAKIETVAGRQGGLPLSAKLAVRNNGTSRSVADLVNTSGRA